MDALNDDKVSKKWFYGGKLCKVCLEYDDNLSEISDYLDEKCKSFLYECDDIVLWDELPCWLCTKCEDVVLQVIQMRHNFKQFLSIYKEICIDRDMYKEVDCSLIKTKISSLREIIEDKTKQSHVTRSSQVDTRKSEAESPDIYMKIEKADEYDIEGDILDVASPMNHNVFLEIQPLQRGNHEKKELNHGKPDDLECDICGQFTNGKISMRGHIKSHLTRYECKVCGVVRASRQHLLEHHATAHSYAHTMYICCHCGKSSTKRTMFQKHMRTHYPSNCKNCDKCGKLFKSIDTLRAHLLRHTDVMRYKCELCPKEFRYASLLYTHKTTHTTTKDYYCVECDASFKTASYLKLHLRKSLKHVDPETFKHECEHCHKRFDRTVSLRQHINWVHLKRRDHKCDNCDATFASQDGLRNHRRKKHEGVKRPRSHVCEVCNKGFMQKAVLQKHLRVHTGERPYECKECGRKFAQESTMSTHYKLVHLKVKRGTRKKASPSNESTLSKQGIIHDSSTPIISPAHRFQNVITI